MSLPLETFQADCVSWNGYKPCDIQKAENRTDCIGCEAYQPGPELHTAVPEHLDPETLDTTDTIGIIEMGGLGSLLRTSAVTRAIRQRNPDAAIAWFTHTRGAELLRYVPGVVAINVDETPLDEQQELAANLGAIINFELSDPAKDIVLHAQRVGGFALNAQGRFHGTGTAAHFQRLQVDDSFRKQNTHTMQEVLLQSVGLDYTDARYDVQLQPENHAVAEEVLKHHFPEGVPDTVIGLNIGTSEKGKLRRWPVERHLALAERLADRHPHTGVLLLSGPQDTELRAHVLEALPDMPTVAALRHNLEVGNFMALLSKLQVVVTGDTFGMHAARAQQVPTVALAGPMPHRELELSPRDRLIGPTKDCSPCYHRCGQAVVGQCMQDIGVELVADEVGRLLEQNQN